MSAPLVDQLDAAPRAKQAHRRDAEPADDGGFARLMAQHQDSARASTRGDNADGDRTDGAGAASRVQHADGRSHQRAETTGKSTRADSAKAATAPAGKAATADAGKTAAEASSSPAAKSHGAARAATVDASMPVAETETSHRSAARSRAAALAALKGVESPSPKGGKQPTPASALGTPAARPAGGTGAGVSRNPETSAASRGDAGPARTAASAGPQSTASNADKPRIDGHAVRIVVDEGGGKVLARPQGTVNAATAVAVTTAAAQGSTGPSSAPEAAGGQTAAAQTTASGFAAEADHTVRKAERDDSGKNSRDGRASRPVKGLTQAATAVSSMQHGQQRTVSDPAAQAEAQLLRQASETASQRTAAEARQSAAPAPDGGTRSASQVAGGHSLDSSIPGMDGSTFAKAGGEAVARGAETQSAERPTPPQPLSDQVAVRLQKAAANGHQRVSVRLQPAELGRIDVKLDIGKDGVVRAIVSADRADTLDILQRDSRELDKALQNAGLKTDGGSLDFNLRSDGDREGPERHHAFGGTAADGTADPDGPSQDNVAEAVRSPVLGSGRIDIRI